MSQLDSCLIASELPSGDTPEVGKIRTPVLTVGGLAPCERFNCPNQSECGARQLACRAFVDFVCYGHVRKPEPHRATRAYFRKAHNDEGDE